MAVAIIGDFDLIIPKDAERTKVELGSETTIPCRLSNGAHFSDDAIEIKWFKETDLVCHYKNRQVIQGKNFENRVSMLTEEINGGNVSVSLKDFSQSDFGDYLCEVTCGERTKEVTIKMEDYNEWKKRRNKKILASVGIIGGLAIPGIGLAGLAFGAAAAGAVAAVAAVAAARAAVTAVAAARAGAVNLILEIIFSIVGRPRRIKTKKEREEMKKAIPLPEPKRRNSNELGHPRMSGETT